MECFLWSVGFCLYTIAKLLCRYVSPLNLSSYICYSDLLLVVIYDHFYSQMSKFKCILIFSLDEFWAWQCPHDHGWHMVSLVQLWGESTCCICDGWKTCDSVQNAKGIIYPQGIYILKTYASVARHGYNLIYQKQSCEIVTSILQIIVVSLCSVGKALYGCIQ